MGRKVTKCIQVGVDKHKHGRVYYIIKNDCNINNVVHDCIKTLGKYSHKGKIENINLSDELIYNSYTHQIYGNNLKWHFYVDYDCESIHMVLKEDWYTPVILYTDLPENLRLTKEEESLGI